MYLTQNMYIFYTFDFTSANSTKNRLKIKLTKNKQITNPVTILEYYK